MTHIRRALLALVLSFGLAPAFAQAPAAVPALPDTERRTSYSITASTCACSVGFQLYGDSTDYQNWVEVFINGVRYDYNDASHGWTITSVSGSLSTLARPITNAVLTFNAVQTGTVQIVGARRPRRTSQFAENTGITARQFNQVLTDIISQNREIWDKTNDMTGRGFWAPPGQTGAVISGSLTGVIAGPSSVNKTGNVATWNGTSGAALADGGAPGAISIFGAPYNAACDGSTDDTAAIQAAWNAAALLGQNVWLGGSGTSCKFSTLTMPTPTGTGKASFLTGPGSSITKLISTVTGTTCAITVSATYGVNSYLTGAFRGFALEQLNQSQGGFGFCLSGITQLTFNDIRFNYFARGISATDTIVVNIQDSLFFWNNVGAYGGQVSSSPPNDWVFLRTGFTHNFQNAILLDRPNQLNVTLGRFESNGLNASGTPVASATTIDINGPPGGPVVGANIENNYWEGNGGASEITLRQSGLANQVGIYNVRGNTFTRTLSAQLGAVSIINNGTGTSFTTVNVGGNGFYDNLNNTAGFAWLSAQTGATTNYTFNCAISNRVDIAAEMPTLCRNTAANYVPAADANNQYIGYAPLNLVTGTTTISGGTSLRVLYDNAGTLGEYTNTQLTALINPATATLSGALPAWPNNATTFLRGDGTYTGVGTSALTGLGTGVATALGVNVGTAGAFVVNGGALGTPSSGVGTNLTALNGSNISSGVVGATFGGAGGISGALKGNGSGVVSQAATTDLSDVSSGTCTWSDQSGVGVTLSGTTDCKWLKIGNWVKVYGTVTYNTTSTANAATMAVGFAGAPTVPNQSYAALPGSIKMTTSGSGAVVPVTIVNTTNFNIWSNGGAANLTVTQVSNVLLRILLEYPGT